MATLSALCRRAEELANEAGEVAPGAEHLLLSAMELPDGSAKRFLEHMGTDPEQLRSAIQQQYSPTLHLPAVNTAPSATQPPVPNQTLYDAKASGKALIKCIYEVHDKSLPLLGLHVVLAASTDTFGREHGLVARSLQLIGIEQAALHKLAQDELKSYAR